MRRLTLLLALVAALSAGAQRETDFAANFLQLHGEGTTLTCTTVSPAMIEKVLQDRDIDKDTEVLQQLRHIRSLRVVSNTEAAETEPLRNAATELLRTNKNRYQLLRSYEGKELYARKRGKTFVEVVLITEAAGRLFLVDLTGNMTQQLIDTLTRTPETTS